MVNRKPSATVVDIEQCGLNRAGPFIRGFFQLTHTVRTHVVEGPAGGWESECAEDQHKLHLDVCMDAWASVPLTPTLFRANCILVKGL